MGPCTFVAQKTGGMKLLLAFSSSPADLYCPFLDFCLTWDTLDRPITLLEH